MIAVAAMTIDHIGVIFVPYGTPLFFVLRAIGRIAFPLFAFMLVEGFNHTRNVVKYLLRIACIGLVIEIAFDIGMLFIDGLEKIQMNVFITLTIGLLTIALLKSKKWYFKLLAIIPITYVAITDIFINYVTIGNYQFPLSIEYGLYGLTIILLFAFTSDIKKRFMGLIFINTIFVSPGFLSLTDINYNFIHHYLQYFSIISIIPIYLYNGKVGIKLPKLFTYLYYPVHMLILYGIFILTELF